MSEQVSQQSLVDEIARAVDGAPSREAKLDSALVVLIQHFDCSAGTIHLLDRNSDVLTLAAHRGIPDVVLGKIQAVPIGKGIAGAAAAQRGPVQLCNLQTDTSGVARPGAKDTKVAGSLAVPMLDGDALRGTVGIGKHVPYEFTPAECELLTEAGRLIAARLPR